MFGAAAMCLSSFCVMTNTLRLSLFKMYSPNHIPTEPCGCDHDHGEQKNEEESEMTKTIKIEGMMCPRCEAHVKAALEGIPGVESAVADRNTGTATVTLSMDVDAALLRSTVEAEGYKTLD